MSKESGQVQQSSCSPPRNSPSKQKSLQQQRSSKKFSLAFPLSPPNLVKRKPLGDLTTSSDYVAVLTRSSDDQTANSTSYTNTRVRLRRESRSQTRKYSAPIDYRDSGVYLGEIDRDPLVETWNRMGDKDHIITGGKVDDKDSTMASDKANMICGTDMALGDKNDTAVVVDGDKDDTITADTLSDKTSTIPTSFKMKGRLHKDAQTGAPLFHSTDSSKSLSAINKINIYSNHNQISRHNTSMHNIVQCNTSPNGTDTVHQIDVHAQFGLDDQCDQSILTDRVLISEKIRRSSKFKQSQRNAQSFSTDNLQDTSEEYEEIIPASCHNNVKFDQDDTDTMQRAVPKRSSFYRRSRSLADDVANNRILENSVDEKGQGNNGQELDDRFVDKKSDIKAMGNIHSEMEANIRERKNKKKRSIADPIAKKLTSTFLKLRPTSNVMTPPAVSKKISMTSEQQQTGTSMNASQLKAPSRDEVRKWASSFEHLLAHKYGIMLFRLFLQREFSEENIDFWTACEEYKKLRDAKLTIQARQIYNDFVAVQAPKEVNLDSVTRSSTMAALTNPNKRTFEQAQHRIQSLMEKDSYPRFLRSDLYLDVLRKC